jgi:hypothetical protein
MEDLATAIRDKTEGLSIPERDQVADRIKALISNATGLAKQCKARQLVDATGSELEKIQVICDLRPIFDEDRKRIEGVVPLSLVRLEYKSLTGDTEVVELRITEKQIDEFQSKLAMAKKKIGLIKHLALSHRLPIPKTKSTVTEED